MLAVGAEDIARDHGVEGGARDRESVVLEYQHVVLEVLSRFRDRSVCQHRPEKTRNIGKGKARGARRLSVGRGPGKEIAPCLGDGPISTDGNIPGLPLLPGQRDSHKAGAHGVGGCGLGVENKQGDSRQLPAECGKLVDGGSDAIRVRIGGDVARSRRSLRCFGAGRRVQGFPLAQPCRQ